MRKMHNKKEIFRDETFLDYQWTNFEKLILHFSCFFGRDFENLSQKSVLKIVQNVKKWLINLNDGLDTKNATPDTGTSLKQI